VLGLADGFAAEYAVVPVFSTGRGDTKNLSVHVVAGGAASACATGLADATGWWSGDDVLTSVTGLAVTGTVGYTAGQVGRAFAFDGSTNVLSVAGFPAVSTGVSVDAWIKPVSTPGVMQALLSRWSKPGLDDTASSYALFLSPTNQLLWTTDDTSTRRPEELVAGFDPAVLYDGSFHHVAATWSPTAMTVYLDGVQIATKVSQGGQLNAAAGTQFRIGGNGGGPLFPYHGAMDEPGTYSRTLSAAEVASISAAGTAGKCTTG
jgi:hypothetical protein